VLTLIILYHQHQSEWSHFPKIQTIMTFFIIGLLITNYFLDCHKNPSFRVSCYQIVLSAQDVFSIVTTRPFSLPYK
jgi:hypothetical protein